MSLALFEREILISFYRDCKEESTALACRAISARALRHLTLISRKQVMLTISRVCVVAVLVPFFSRSCSRSFTEMFGSDNENLLNATKLENTSDNENLPNATKCH